MSTNDKDYAYLPIDYPNLEKYFNDQNAVFWTLPEIDTSRDRADWERSSSSIQEFTKKLLCLFAQADGIVCENLVENFKSKFSFIKSARNFYAAQDHIEVIHNQTYSELINVLIRDEEEKQKALEAIHNYPEIRNIYNWISRWMSKETPDMEALVAFCCLEGIIFIAGFAGVYQLKRLNLFEGLTSANELIAFDESLHTKFGAELYKTLHLVIKERIDENGQKFVYNKLETRRVHEIIQSCITEAIEPFVRNVLQVDLVGLTAEDMMMYVKCAGNELCEILGEPELYQNIKNPFDWMVLILTDKKTNFFEKKVTQYQKSESKVAYNFDENF